MSDQWIRMQTSCEISYVILHGSLGVYSSRGYTSVTTSVGKRKPTFLCIQATRISAAIFYFLVQREPKKDRKSISGNVSEADARPGNSSRDLFARNSNVGRAAESLESSPAFPFLHRAYRSVSNFMRCGKRSDKKRNVRELDNIMCQNILFPILKVLWRFYV